MVSVVGTVGDDTIAPAQAQAGVATEIGLGLATSAIGSGITLSVQHVRRSFRERAVSRAARAFFGIGRAPIRIIHSSVYDPPENAYNYPATDTRAARELVQLFESMQMREGVDFTVEPDRRITNTSLLREDNTVLLCGPARNGLSADLLGRTDLRYQMHATRGVNVLTDTQRPNVRYLPSRELPLPPTRSFDYGLIASFPHPGNSERRVVVLAGIHGTGTVGAAEYVCTPGNLERIVKAFEYQRTSLVVRVDYDDADLETPTGVTEDFVVS